MASRGQGALFAGAALGALALLLFAGGEAEPAPAEPRRPRKKTPPGKPAKPIPANPPPPAAMALSGPIEPIGSTKYTQPDIVAAAWASLADHDDRPIKDIAFEISRLTPELQTYTAAALESLKPEFAIWNDTLKDFAKYAGEQEAEARDRINKENAIIAAAGTVANYIPIYGQVISAIIGIIAALKKAFEDPAIASEIARIWKTRLTNLDFLKDWEGSDAIRGLKIDRRYPPLRLLKLEIEGDLLASRLPLVPFGYKYYFVPRIDQFRRLGKQAGLYSNEYIKKIYGFSPAWILEKNDDWPVSAIEIWKYSLGYQVMPGEAGSDDSHPWFRIGYSDARAGKPFRVGTDLLIWANAFFEDEE
ncbi:hypothetical protein [Haliangium sp. UPWRP_2]|uniref:hypothetical protein n=1 Tax=Haliangium sp. UPWRP_2 TaxID=1931276 RepID=UPI000B547446|nr:hypothetical protein [Haliangium sp. UPWRP_2]